MNPMTQTTHENPPPLEVRKVWANYAEGTLEVSVYMNGVGPSFVILDEGDLSVRASHWGLTVPEPVLSAARDAARKARG